MNYALKSDTMTVCKGTYKTSIQSSGVPRNFVWVGFNKFS